MRGRRPTPLTLAAADLPILEAVARIRRLCWFQVQHARIVLAVAGGERVHEVASRLECDRATVWRVCRRYEQGGLSKLLLDDPRLGRPQEISPLQQAQIVELACLEPVAEGLHVTHWTSADLARQAIADGIVEAIGPAMVRRILREVDLQPHRTRYWRTARLDGRFKERAEKVLWCYGNAERLARRGIWVVCTDEVPNLQVLERTPTRRAIPGHIEQREFEYTRHGTVNLLLFLVVHTGRMEVTVLGANDAAHYIPALRDFRRRHRGLKGVFLIHDGGSSHIAQDTSDYLEGSADWWRPRLTPAHASWRNQAELLVRAFGGRYVKRGSWATRQEFIEHVRAAGPEYNRLYAHPFDWTWTNDRMRTWYAEHAR
jgi:transposase